MAMQVAEPRQRAEWVDGKLIAGFGNIATVYVQQELVEVLTE
jgi:hypothetical protein